MHEEIPRSVLTEMIKASSHIREGMQELFVPLPAPQRDAVPETRRDEP